MQIRTSEATPLQLNWLVAKCEGASADTLESYIDGMREADDGNYSTNWAQGGPIIEREKIAVRFEPECHWLFAPPEATWLANYNGVGEWYGPTPLIAAMRCYVASKLGDTIDVPEELINV